MDREREVIWQGGGKVGSRGVGLGDEWSSGDIVEEDGRDLEEHTLSCFRIESRTVRFC